MNNNPSNSDDGPTRSEQHPATTITTTSEQFESNNHEENIRNSDYQETGDDERRQDGIDGRQSEDERREHGGISRIKRGSIRNRNVSLTSSMLNTLMEGTHHEERIEQESDHSEVEVGTRGVAVAAPNNNGMSAGEAAASHHNAYSNDTSFSSTTATGISNGYENSNSQNGFLNVRNNALDRLRMPILSNNTSNNTSHAPPAFVLGPRFGTNAPQLSRANSVASDIDDSASANGISGGNCRPNNINNDDDGRRLRGNDPPLEISGANITGTATPIIPSPSPYEPLPYNPSDNANITYLQPNQLQNHGQVQVHNQGQGQRQENVYPVGARQRQEVMLPNGNQVMHYPAGTYGGTSALTTPNISQYGVNYFSPFQSHDRGLVSIVPTNLVDLSTGRRQGEQAGEVQKQSPGFYQNQNGARSSSEFSSYANTVSTNSLQHNNPNHNNHSGAGYGQLYGNGGMNQLDSAVPQFPMSLEMPALPTQPRVSSMNNIDHYSAGQNNHMYLMQHGHVNPIVSAPSPSDITHYTGTTPLGKKNASASSSKKRKTANTDKLVRRPQKRFSVDVNGNGKGVPEDESFGKKSNGKARLTTNKSRKVELLDMETRVQVSLFDSCSDAARQLNINRTKLSRTCRSGGGRIEPQNGKGGCYFCQYAEMAKLNVSSEDTSAGGVSTEDVSKDNVSTEDVSKENVSTEDVSTEDISTEDVSTEDVYKVKDKEKTDSSEMANSDEVDEESNKGVGDKVNQKIKEEQEDCSRISSL